MILPIGVSFKTFAGSLVTDYPYDNVPILSDEKNWKKWAAALIEEPSFAKNGPPGPSGFEEPVEWAKELYKVMNNT